MKIGIRVTSALFILIWAAAFSFSESVWVKQGNIYFRSKDGQVSQLTSSGLDLDPSLSLDGQLVVFVRRTPTLQIDTARGLPSDENELWIAKTSGKVAPERILAGHPGSVRIGEDLVLAGFSSPQFSPDAMRIYFLSAVWANNNAMQVLDLGTGAVRFLGDCRDFEVLSEGRYAGYLVALKEAKKVWGSRTFRYYLIGPSGHDLGEIGETKTDIREFKDAYK